MFIREPDNAAVISSGPQPLDTRRKAGTLWQRMLLAGLENANTGSLRVRGPGVGELIRVGGDGSGLAAECHIHRTRSFRRIMLRGAMGVAESYMDGDWDSPDLVTLLRFGLRNGERLENRLSASFLLQLADRLRHRLNANTRRGSRRNIRFHYDLGNDFYAAWLDAGMQYSSALFNDESDSLEMAQRNKLERIEALLELSHGMNLLEIGCGWGALAERIASRYRCDVTGITLSVEQKKWADDRLKSKGLSERSAILLKDYRDIEGEYERIVSIEMMEAVGEENWPVYLEKINQLLKPGGTALIQVILISDDAYPAYRRNVDFIQRYIFPGGMLPCDSTFQMHCRKAGLTLSKRETFGKSYALTLAEWRKRFQAAWPTLSRLGYDERFRRLWEYYLAYCEAGFREGHIDVAFYQLRKPAV